VSAQTQTTSSDPAILQALKNVGSLAVFAAAPVAVLATMLAVGLDPGPLSHDFHYELYPEAQALIDGRNPFPRADFDPLGTMPNLIWPPVAAFLVSPLTALPLAAADVAIALVGLACFAAALWLVGVRDWRVYGTFALWPQVAGEMRVSHLTPAIAVLLAVAWRYRHSDARTGAAIGAAVALKLFVWPLAFWLAVNRRARACALAVALALSSLLLVLPYTGLDAYFRALTELGRTFDQDSYTVFGLLAQLGLSDGVARLVTFVAGSALLVGVWRYRSFTLAVGASLVLSPIVWLDYFAVLAVPLAVVRPRLSPIWLVPLLTWGAAGSGFGIGESVETARVLGCMLIVLAVAFHGERARMPRGIVPGNRPGQALAVSP
jgi:hypothetical protein